MHHRASQRRTKILVHTTPITLSQGFTRFSTFADLSAPTAADWDTCFAVNVKAQTHLLKAALSTFNANAEGGVFIVTSSIAGTRPSGSSMPYSVTKAAQLHLMRCFASTQGPKIRVNAVLPGLLLTEWGQLYGETMVKRLEERAWLKKVVGHDISKSYQVIKC
jgi:NAD(P)-dependent dehydrogenase (short-subunit alcohol dehydrogenase family)